jgi:hypothetical protein
MKKYKVKGVEIEDSGISTYVVDIENELTKILSESIAKEIDKEILRSLGIFERPIRRKNSINKIFND